MPNNWQRVGHISREHQYRNPLGETYYQVDYVNNAFISIVNRIELQIRHDTCWITLRFSPLQLKEIQAQCEHFSIPFEFEKHEFTQFISEELHARTKEKNRAVITLQANLAKSHFPLNEKTFMALASFCSHFNRKYEMSPFSEELLLELQAIYQAVESKTYHQFEHRIMGIDSLDFPLDYPTHRPDYEKLADVIAYYPQSHRLARKYLMEGDDPNQSQDYIGYKKGYRPLTYAVLRYFETNMLALLLWYNANFFSRSLGGDSLNSCSAFELAFAFGQEKKLALMREVVSQAQRIDSKFNVADKLRVVDSVVYQNATSHISSMFIFSNNKEINTCLKMVADLTEEESAAVFELFKANFEVPNDLDDLELKTIFTKDFDKKKTIDLIYDQDKIIGFNLYEFVKLANDKKRFYLNCNYAAIAHDYRRYGLMVFLTFRMAYILQLILKDRQVGVFFCAAHFNSYRMVSFSHYPKYQPEYIHPILNDLLNAVMHQDYYAYHDLITHYIIDQLRVRNSPPNANPSLNEQCYYQEILGLTDEEKTEAHLRAAPILFIVGNENYTQVKELANKIGVNFDSHILKYARFFRPFLAGNYDVLTSDLPNVYGLLQNCDTLFKAKKPFLWANDAYQSILKHKL